MELHQERVYIKRRIAQFFGINLKPENVVVAGYEDWSKLDEVLRKLATLEIVLAGGTIISAFNDVATNDLDFYLTDPLKKDAALTMLREYFNHGEPFYTKNAVTLKRKVEGSRKMYTVQLITAFHGTPAQILDWFDFTITQGAYNFATNEFTFGERFFSDNISKTLIFQGKSKYPICAMYRTKKYQARGYKLPSSTIMHLALAIVQLKITNYRELKDQLMGIDTMYLQNLLAKEGFEPHIPVDYGDFVAKMLAYLQDQPEENDE
jgi:hypothetical protein